MLGRLAAYVGVIHIVNIVARATAAAAAMSGLETASGWWLVAPDCCRVGTHVDRRSRLRCVTLAAYMQKPVAAAEHSSNPTHTCSRLRRHRLG